MHQLVPKDPRIFRPKTCKLLLAAWWITGLLFGIFAAAGAGDHFLLTMRGEFFTVSISGLLITCLPFLLTAAAVLVPHRGFLVPLVLWEAFSFGFCAYGLSLVHQDSGWLVRMLLMFTQLTTMPVLMWLWLRGCDPQDRISPPELFAAGCAVALLGAVDHCLVSPFAALLL